MLYVSIGFLYNCCYVDRRSKQAQIERYYGNMNRVNPQAQTFSFQSSTVTYGGANGAYYTSSSTRRMGGDGVSFLFLFLFIFYWLRTRIGIWATVFYLCLVLHCRWSLKRAKKLIQLQAEQVTGSLGELVIRFVEWSAPFIGWKGPCMFCSLHTFIAKQLERSSLQNAYQFLPISNKNMAKLLPDLIIQNTSASKSPWRYLGA